MAELELEHDKIIIGIDPGTNVMGYGILGIKGKTPSLIAMGVLKLNAMEDHYMRLHHIFERVTSLIAQYLPDEMAIEAPFFGKNVQSMLKLGRAQGVAMAAALNREIPITEYEPSRATVPPARSRYIPCFSAHSISPRRICLNSSTLPMPSQRRFATTTRARNRCLRAVRSRGNHSSPKTPTA